MLTTIDLKNKIILELLFSKKCCLEESIDYKKFKLLHSNYYYLPEIYFASVLGIRYANFQTCKKGSNNIIFKEVDLSLFDETIEKLIREEIIHYNQSLTYLQFLKILSYVPFFSENILAALLGITVTSFQNLKYGRSQTTKILKRYNISEKEEFIVQQLIQNKVVYPGMQLTYEKFKEIHKFFPDINERRFAYMLEIKKDAYYSLKDGRIKPFILKSRVIAFVKEQKEYIINFLINFRNAKLNESIDKNRFLELYSGFEYIDEVNFAQIILGINYGSFSALNHSNALIFKNRIELTDSIRENFFHNILEQFNLKEGDLIDYATFCDILNIYKDILNEFELCTIIGIEGGQFSGLKYNGIKARVINGVTREKINFMRKNFVENRFYSKEEIYSIIQEYGITIQDFIIHIINNRQFFLVDDYMSALENNNGLFIGKTTIDLDFFNNEYNNIKKQLEYIWFSLIFNDIQEKKDDIFQELLLYIYQNCGDLYYNFGNSKIFFQRVKKRAKKYIIKLLINLNTKFQEVSLWAYEDKMALDHNINFKDSKVDIENEVIYDEEIYEQLLIMLENGCSLEDCLTTLEKSNQKENSIYPLIKKQVLQLKGVN